MKQVVKTKREISAELRGKEKRWSEKIVVLKREERLANSPESALWMSMDEIIDQFSDWKATKRIIRVCKHT